jgi:hypothetical protein
LKDGKYLLVVQYIRHGPFPASTVRREIGKGSVAQRLLTPRVVQPSFLSEPLAKIRDDLRDSGPQLIETEASHRPGPVYGRGSSVLNSGAMELITILNRCHRFRRFVYQHAHFSADKKSIEVAVRPRKGSGVGK